MIEGKYVNLRALEKEDLELLKKWRNDKRTRTHTREYRLLKLIIPNKKIAIKYDKST